MTNDPSMASAIFKSARWRCDGVESRQSTNASLAALKAASISAAFDLGAVAKGCPVAGLIKVVVSPEVESTDLPLMKLLSFFMFQSLAISPRSN